MENIIVRNNLRQEIVTFGCRLNIYESEIIRKNLELSGLDNVAIFNTCAVTKSAEKQARQAIRKAKKNNPDLKIIVTGCSAQANPKMYGNMSEVDKVIGNEEKLLSHYYQITDQKISVNDIMSVKETACHLVSSFDGKSRAFIQVQNGCDHNCTFCIIPYGRGRSRSTPIGTIVAQVKHLVLKGFKEVVITGVDVTAYGSDLPGSPTFAQMIKRVLNLVPELKRIRLSSIDIAEVDDEFFELIAYSKRIMPHFHISLQSGDDMILKRMKRRHNRASVIEFCQKLRAIRPEVSFGADIIAGFPTETNEMFENTRKLILEAELQYLHVFPYSEREGTPAIRMPQVPKNIRKERAKILRQDGYNQLTEFFKKHIGQKVELLIENNNVAHTENFIPVKLDKYLAIGQIFKAELVGIENGYMKCVLI
ncbi:tRNA (N(6)-L-threonylcarbamoyladenosine(37)-C(2))-methylthiotransferase MtaB [Rickettsia typhi]|uniref:tRNA-methylthiotransferase (MiaB protein) n=2 Tax=Rickettsia typhi TaxID=785 RepID=Q68WW3_RICTY|nr:tRNA (N(6)-L-threonylcarbamoyladenosine(37)-C(2))-methylthiotransferase MtaB [Rickettsia typhi]AAU03879.1 tRNA-methylthiotransferase (MiaB protein) [Rickettsia typhi str. Wilmington]AFE54261.1 tRNA-methylthiotransferase (MiaB protein) [Rickettsia typhi str. TH1527]AFE55101.1 tRNA-methylthiotransferase (MiaB protein) [Rickettsia typhi str. B9991CWPP]